MSKSQNLHHSILLSSLLCDVCLAFSVTPPVCQRDRLTAVCLQAASLDVHLGCGGGAFTASTISPH